MKSDAQKFNMEEVNETSESHLQSQLNQLRQQLDTVTTKKLRKQIEKSIEDTALSLGKLKISKNAIQFERHTLYHTFDPPLPTKSLQPSNLELFALNEVNTEKTEHGLHKKLEFLHTKALHQIDVEITDDDPKVSTSTTSSPSASSEDIQTADPNLSINPISVNALSLCSPPLSPPLVLSPDPHLESLQHIQVPVTMHGLNGDSHSTPGTPNPLISPTNTAPITAPQPSQQFNDFNDFSAFNPPSSGVPTYSNWWIDRLYDVNGQWCYVPQPGPLAMAPNPRFYGSQEDHTAYSEVLVMDRSEYSVSEYAESAYTAETSSCELSEDPLADSSTFSESIGLNAINSYPENEEKEPEKEESPPMWVNVVETNEEISPDDDSNCSLNDVIAAKREERYERKKRKKELIQKLNAKSKKKHRHKHGRHRKRKRPRRKHRKRSRSVDFEETRTDGRSKTVNVPVTEAGLSKREEFRKKYAHLFRE